MGRKSVNDFTVTENKQLNVSNYLLKLSSATDLPKFFPGQFVNIDIANSREIFLRRPFSVFDVDYRSNSLSVLVKILGRGSKSLTKIAIGEKVSLIYPLGKSFTLPEKNEKILAIGGGSGIAPLLFLAKESKLPTNHVDIILGARDAAEHIDAGNYNEFARLHFTTEDGSLGTKGFVTHHPVFIENLKNYDKVYACGPDAMMKAVAREAKKQGVFCEVSLENLMACGFGVCLCCIEPTKNGNKCVCTDGPVFNINNLKWQI